MTHTTLQKIFSVLNCKARMEKVSGPLSCLSKQCSLTTTSFDITLSYNDSHVVRHGSFHPEICKALPASFKGWRSNLDHWEPPCTNPSGNWGPKLETTRQQQTHSSHSTAYLVLWLRWQMHSSTLASRWARGFWPSLASWTYCYVQMKAVGVRTPTHLTAGPNCRWLSAKLGIQSLRNGFCTACPMAPNAEHAFGGYLQCNQGLMG